MRSTLGEVLVRLSYFCRQCRYASTCKGTTACQRAGNRTVRFSSLVHDRGLKIAGPIDLLLCPWAMSSSDATCLYQHHRHLSRHFRISFEATTAKVSRRPYKSWMRWCVPLMGSSTNALSRAGGEKRCGDDLRFTLIG